MPEQTVRPNVLDEIVSHKRSELAQRKTEMPVERLHEKVGAAAPARDFRTALRKPGVSLIAEVKRASPTRGNMLPGADAVEIAATYEQCGARAISVLTDQKYFGGSLEDLERVHDSVRVPVLRKEFIIDEYQVYESRAAQADAILLIARILSVQQIDEYIELARLLGMSALVEVHTAEEIERVLQTRAHIIGINNRDLDTLEVNLERTFELKRLVPGGHILVSESGIYTRDQVHMLDEGGVDAILVGEALVRSGDIRAKLGELLQRDEG